MFSCFAMTLSITSGMRPNVITSPRKPFTATSAEAKELLRIKGLFSPQRERAALALVRTIERQSLFAVYGLVAIPELRSRRLGCIVHQPEYAGIDLAALCLKDSDD